MQIKKESYNQILKFYPYRNLKYWKKKSSNVTWSPKASLWLQNTPKELWEAFAIFCGKENPNLERLPSGNL